MIGADQTDMLRSVDGFTPPVTYAVDEHGRILVTLGMEPKAFQTLVDLAESSGTSLEEVISKAFLLYQVTAEARQQNKAVGIASSADVLESEFVGL